MLTRSFNSTLDRMLTLNRAFDQAFTSGLAHQRVWVPATDVVETKDAYEVHTELPGVEASQIDVSFEQNILTIRGTKSSKIDSANGEELRVHAAERVSGSFERTIRVPEFVDGVHIGARFENGLLTVSVPKAQAAQARKIQIEGSQSAEVGR